MTDINELVERRIVSLRLSGNPEDWKFADALESQQQRIEQLEKDVDGLMTLLAKEKAKNERLRTALEEIGGWRFPPQGNEQYFDMRYENGREAAAKIAREALKETDDD